MTTIRVKGLKFYKDRHGKDRCYHRASGVPIDLQKFPRGSAEFLSEIARLGLLNSPLKTSKPGLLEDLIKQYQQSPAYITLSDSTKDNYQRIFKYLTPFYKVPLIQFDKPNLQNLYDKCYNERGRDNADRLKAVLSLLFSWAVQRGYLKENHAMKIVRMKKGRQPIQANVPWSDSERFHVLQQLASHKHLLIPIALCMYTGLRESDALRVTRDSYDGEGIRWTTAKSGKEVYWPVPAVLKTILDPYLASRKDNHYTLALNSRGKPWTTDGFKTSWGKFKTNVLGASYKHLTIHGLRHTLATTIREMGYDERTIADALGQKTPGMALHYSRKADLKKVQQSLVASLDEMEMDKMSNHRQKLSNLKNKSEQSVDFYGAARVNRTPDPVITNRETRKTSE